MDKKIFYITKGKLKELKKEYEELLEIDRKKTMSEQAPKIFESEDLNPEFISFQEDVEFLRSRIDELKNILENYELIKNLRLLVPLRQILLWEKSATSRLLAGCFWGERLAMR